MATITEDGKIHELSREEGIALLERQTRRVLGMSATEFIEAWESGALDDHPNHIEVMDLVLLIPFAQ